MKYAIVVDSTTKFRKDFMKEISNKIDVRVVPVRIYIDQQEYNDSDELSDVIVEAIKNNQTVETSLPSIKLVEELFEELSDKYEKTYVLSVSSVLSGTYNLFSTTASKYENIKVFDSKSVSIQNTYIFERMVMDILNGKEIEDDDIISYKDDSLFLISVFDLTQLHKSGRIGKVTSILGKLMHVKPILTVERTGEVGLIAKALSSSKLLSTLDGYVLTFIKKLLQREGHQNEENVSKIINNIGKLNIEDIEKMFAIYAAVGSEDYKDFVYNIATKYSIKPTFLDIGPAVTVHVGLQGFGILIAKKVK